MRFEDTPMTKSQIENTQRDTGTLAENYGPIGIRAVAAACALRRPPKDSGETPAIASLAPHEGDSSVQGRLSFE